MSYSPLAKQATKHIPTQSQVEVMEYLDNGIAPGSFVRSILENNLMMATIKADNYSASKLYAYGRMLSVLPPACYGSKDKVNAWLERKGFNNYKGEAK